MVEILKKRIRNLTFSDKAKIKVARISENGTLELTRQRIKHSHRYNTHVECKHCCGTGFVRDNQSLAISAFRKLEGHLAKRRMPLSRVTVLLPLDVVNYLGSIKRFDLLKLEENYKNKYLYFC